MLFASLAWLFLSHPPTSSALDYVKLDETAANGDCLPEIGDTEVEPVLQSHGVRVEVFRGANEGHYRKTVARVIKGISSIGDGRIQSHRDRRIVFAKDRPAHGMSGANGNSIIVVPDERNRRAQRIKDHGGRDNLALIAHEICHNMATRSLNERGLSAHLGGSQCLVSKYAGTVKTVTKNFSDQEVEIYPEMFTEACTAFIMNPALLDATGPCRKAREFFAIQFGEKRPQERNCGAGPSSTRPNRPDSKGDSVPGVNR